jgi:thioredoxin 2
MSKTSLHIVCPSCGAINRVQAGRPAADAKCGKCHQPLFQGKPVSVDAAAFDRHLTRNDIPMVVDFWASWCGPCLAMAPAYERAAAELEPEYRLLKVDSDEQQALAVRYQIRSIPTLMLFVDGQPVARNAGAMDTSSIVSWVRSHTADSPPEKS